MRSVTINAIALSVILASPMLILFDMDAPAVEAIETKAAATELIALTNVSRTSNGLRSLFPDNRLNTVAVSRSDDMIKRNYFSHTIPPNDTTVVDILESLGVAFTSAGENIAWNNALDFTTVQGASEDFMNSLNHRQNVLDPRWDRLGSGVAQEGDKKMYTVLFMQLPSATQRKAPSGSIQAPAATTTDPSASVPSGSEGGSSGASFTSHQATPSPSTQVEVPREGSGASSRERGGLVSVSVGRTGLMDSLIDRLLRLYLNF